MEAELVWGLGFLALALMFMIIEMFVPTFGVLALVAAGCGVTGVVLLFNHSTAWGLVGAALVVVGGPAIFFFGLQIMPNTAIGRRLVLSNSGDEDGEGDGPRRATVADTFKDLLGAEGVVMTDLRPVGTIRVGDARLDALAETDVLRAGAKVKVVGIVDGQLLKVRAIT